MKFFDQPGLSSISDYHLKAKKRLPDVLYEFLEGGAFDEVTIRKNREDFHNIQLKRRVLNNALPIQTETEILGQKAAFPLILAPVGFAGVYARRGEVQAAKAAEKANVPFSLSTVSICSIEEVSPSPFWFQFYLFKDRGHSLELLNRASSAGCPVLMLTVDLPVPGARHRYNRSKNSASFYLKPSWWWDVYLRGGPLTMGNIPSSAPKLSDLASMRKWMGSQVDPHLSWKDLEWIRDNWKGKVVIKGILDAEDAKMAVKAGLDGIVVSNHGGRHLDGTLSTIQALPAICDAVKGDLTILIDGGISSGLDIVKALAVGAEACMIGRPWVYGLAAEGEKGVSEVIRILHHEMKIVMAHLGVDKVKEINGSLIIKPFA